VRFGGPTAAASSQRQHAKARMGRLRTMRSGRPHQPQRRRAQPQSRPARGVFACGVPLRPHKCSRADKI